MPARSRRFRWLRSLRVRVLIVAAAVAIAPLAIVAAASLVESGVGDRMLASVEGATLEAGRGVGMASSDEQRQERLDDAALYHGARLQWLDPSGRVLLESDGDTEARPVRALADVFFGPDGAPTLAEFDAGLGPMAERDAFAVAATVGSRSQCETSETGTLLVCSSLRRISRHSELVGFVHAQASSRRAIRALYDLRYQLLKLTLFIVPCALLLAWWLGWRMVKPIERLRAQALSQVEAVSPGADLDLERADEFGELAAALNRMLAEVRARAEDKEAFVADLAHEFKNPVAAIRAAAESMGEGSLEAERAARLARVLTDSSVRLDRLVTQFLELARAEAGIGEERADVDVAALARGVVTALRDDERFEGVNLECDAPEPATVPGVASGLETVLRNLVENAGSFAGPGGSVRVVVESGDPVRIEVVDTGPGIPAADLPHIFDRFFTKRSSGRGTGLGLALVRAITVAHGGRVTATSVQGEGTTLSLRLPGVR